MQSGCLDVSNLLLSQGLLLEQEQPRRRNVATCSSELGSELVHVCLRRVPTCVFRSLRKDLGNRTSVEHEQHSQAASSLHKNTPVNILSADSLADNQMTIRAPGFSVLSAAATVIHADKLKIQCPSSALLRLPIHAQVAKPVYRQFLPFLILMSGLAVEWPRHKSSQCWPHPVWCPQPPASFLHVQPAQRDLFPFNKCLAWNCYERKHEESSGVVVPRGKGGNAAKGIPLLPRPPSFLLLTFATIRLQIASCLHASPGWHITPIPHIRWLFFRCDKNGPKHHPLHRNLASTQQDNQRLAQRTGYPVIKGRHHESKLFVYEIRCW